MVLGQNKNFVISPCKSGINGSDGMEGRGKERMMKIMVMGIPAVLGEILLSNHSIF